MCDHMSLHVTLDGKSFITHGTDVRTNTRVCSAVYVQVRLTGQDLAALDTYKLVRAGGEGRKRGRNVWNSKDGHLFFVSC